MSYQILVVDDEVPMLQCMERILRERSDLTLKTTANSLHVKELLEASLYDIVITDLRMPGFSGLELAREIKQKNRGESVIIITAFGSLETAVEAFRTGISAYITKPFTREQIMEAVDIAVAARERFLLGRQYAALLYTTPFDLAAARFKENYISYFATHPLVSSNQRS